MEHWPDYTRFAVALFSILAPFSAIPIFLALTQDRSAAERRRIADIASLTTLATLLAAGLGGERFLALIGTSLASFRVGGGIILLLMAVSMLRAETSRIQHTPEEAEEASTRATVGVVPLGIPLLAGPGAISTTIIEAQRGHGIAHLAVLGGCIAAIAATLWLSLRLAVPIGHMLGATGLNILTRLFGLLLAAVAVEIMAGGLRVLFPGLG